MPQRIRLGTVTNGSLDSTDATIEIDGDDLYITVENGDVRTDGTVAFEDATADPTANGEIQRNGADLKAYSGGAVRNLSDIGGASAVIDDTDSPYTTSDEDVIYVDESGGAVTVELASADATLGNEIEVVNLTGTNTVTVSTEGSETIDPDADASKAITKAGWAVGFVSDGTNWTAGVTGEFESVTADKADTRNGYSDVSGSRSFDTTETNNTGADLNVSVVAVSNSADTDVNVDIVEDGTVVDKTRNPSSDNAQRASVQATIPAGSDYTVRAFGDTADFSIDSWVEQS